LVCIIFGSCLVPRFPLCNLRFRQESDPELTQLLDKNFGNYVDKECEAAERLALLMSVTSLSDADIDTDELRIERRLQTAWCNRIASECRTRATPAFIERQATAGARKAAKKERKMRQEEERREREKKERVEAAYREAKADRAALREAELHRQRQRQSQMVYQGHLATQQWAPRRAAGPVLANPLFVGLM
jgi:hypothetical protein